MSGTAMSATTNLHVESAAKESNIVVEQPTKPADTTRPRNGDTNKNDNDDEESSGSSSSSTYVDNPYWGSPSDCRIRNLLAAYSKDDLILYESQDFLVLNKPPDVRMDGNYPVTVHKLLTYLYPPPSVLQAFEQHEQQQQQQQQGISIAVEDHHDSTTNEATTTTTTSADLKEQEVDLARDLRFQEFIETRYHRHSDHEDNQLRPCHQLDYATSGVLWVARSRMAANTAKDVLENRHVQKEYLAVVHGTLAIPTKWTVVPSLEYVQQRWKAMEHGHRRKRQKQQSGTFIGYQPPHAIYQQWQAQQQQQQQNNSMNDDEETTTTNSTIKKNKFNKKRKHNEMPPLTPEQWSTIWKPLYETPGFAVQADTTWTQAKQLNQTDRFEKAAKIYNDLRRQQLQIQQQQHQEHEACLPLVFRIDQDPTDTFYVCASMSDLPDQFAVVLNPEETVPTFLKPTSHLLKQRRHTNNNNNQQQPRRHNNNNQQKQPPELFFRPCLTQCTILQHIVDPHDGSRSSKVRLVPWSGRRHQLRIHMALIGHPIVGDCTYNTSSKRRKKNRNKDGEVQRMCLHAHTLTVPAPSLGATKKDNNNDKNVLQFQAPDPFL